jgi:hypothetical protein
MRITSALREKQKCCFHAKAEARAPGYARFIVAYMTRKRTTTTNATATIALKRALSAHATINTAATAIPHKEGGHRPKSTIDRCKIHGGTTSFVPSI